MLQPSVAHIDAEKNIISVNTDIIFRTHDEEIEYSDCMRAGTPNVRVMKMCR